MHEGGVNHSGEMEVNLRVTDFFQCAFCLQNIQKNEFNFGQRVLINLGVKS